MQVERYKFLSLKEKPAKPPCVAQYFLIQSTGCSVSPLVLTYQFPACSTSLLSAFCNIRLEVLLCFQGLSRSVPFHLSPMQCWFPPLASPQSWLFSQIKAFFFFSHSIYRDRLVHAVNGHRRQRVWKSCCLQFPCQSSLPRGLGRADRVLRPVAMTNGLVFFLVGSP